MLRYCVGSSLEEHCRIEEITTEANIIPFRDVIRNRWLEMYCHVLFVDVKGDEDIRRVNEIKVEGSRGHGWTKQSLSDIINADLRWLYLDQSNTRDQVR